MYSISNLFIFTMLLSSCGDVAAQMDQAFWGKSANDKTLVGPYVQNVTPTSAVVAWESEASDSVSLQVWNENFAQTVIANESKILPDGVFVHHAMISDLEPDTTYSYEVSSGSNSSKVFRFTTAPLRGQRKSFEFFAYSDCQKGPKIHDHIVNEVLINRADGRLLSERYAFGLVAGDIVQNGDEQQQYRSRFFNPIQNISSQVPYYVAIGNHENDSRTYFDYMNLPKNGTPGFEEHWYSFDYANTHIIGLDSNSRYQLAEQIEWLRADLESVCHDPEIEMVFSFFHHPHHSEIWPIGESEYSGKFVQEMEKFVKDCGKAGAYFFGHTHAYARGQSRDVPLYHVNVGSAGGELDKWGEYEHRDYPEFEISESEFGVVTVKVNVDEQVGFQSERLSVGDGPWLDQMKVSDMFAWTQEVQEVGNLEIESDGEHEFLASNLHSLPAEKIDVMDLSAHEIHWQAVDRNGLIVDESWQRRRNIFWNKDTVQSENYGRYSVADVDFQQVRMRVRNSNLHWSDWKTVERIRE